MRKFAELCWNWFGSILLFDFYFCIACLAGVLGKIPRAIALMLWVPFSLFWILVAGPIMSVAELVLAPMAFWDEFLRDDYGSVAQRVCSALQNTIGCTLIAVPYRLFVCGMILIAGVCETE